MGSFSFARLVVFSVPYTIVWHQVIYADWDPGYFGLEVWVCCWSSTRHVGAVVYSIHSAFYDSVGRLEQGIHAEAIPHLCSVAYGLLNFPTLNLIVQLRNPQRGRWHCGGCCLFLFFFAKEMFHRNFPCEPSSGDLYRLWSQKMGSFQTFLSRQRGQNIILAGISKNWEYFMYAGILANICVCSSQDRAKVKVFPPCPWKTVETSRPQFFSIASVLPRPL